MAELKTKITNASVKSFIDKVESDKIKRECRILLKIFKVVTGKRPKMWGANIVGYGSYHYKYASGREGDWMLTGFSPRKGNISIYVMSGFKEMSADLKKLGPHKTGKSCLYIKNLEELDQKILKKILITSLKYMKKNYETT